MTITSMHCPSCDITVKGSFSAGRSALLDDEINHFIGVFLLARGNIKEIERRLGISYPTVKAKIDKMVAEVQRVTRLEQELAEALKEEREAQKRSEENVRKLTMDK
jgi:hypothetical protein